MPDSLSSSWEEMRLGSFVHMVLDKGVRKGFRNLKEFIDLANEAYLDEEWNSIDILAATNLVKIFFERNRGKYSSFSKTEYRLKMRIGGLSFIGVADRIDFGHEGIEIIDYKTGFQPISPKHRNWQLGYYALAARALGNVHKVTLDMLRHEKPLEFSINQNGDAKALYSSRMEFNIYQVEQEIAKAAHQLLGSYENGFLPCSLEKNCEFCREYIYG